MSSLKKTPDLSRYKKWLIDQGYQPSTVEVSLRHIRALSRVDWTHPRRIPEYRNAHIRRYLRYVELEKKHPLGKRFALAMRHAGLVPTTAIAKQGSRAKTLLGSTDWTVLRGKLRRGDDASKLLVAYMQSPYRISEFLRQHAHQISEEDIADKISRDWIIEVGGRQPLYQILCETERCTYYRLRRRLQEVCAKLGYDVDFDTLYKSYHEIKAA
jgi:hypothetical protein